MGLSLNTMIEQALAEGHAGVMSKIAADEGEGKTCQSCGRPAVPNSEYCQACAGKKAEKEQRPSEDTEKTSSERVEKLAAAVEYALDNTSWLGTVGRVKMAEGEGVNLTGPARGPNTLPTTINDPTTDKMPAGFSGSKINKIPEAPAKEPGATPKAAPNAMQTDKNVRPGGPGNQPEDGVLVQKQGSAVDRIKSIMRKSAEDGATTNISTPKTQTTTLPENQPSQMARPAEVTSQEQQMISSNEAAINATKREAKAVPKKRMGEVLDEPAQSKSGDSALHDALGADLVSQAGAKVASARIILQKLASEGCQCNGQGTCALCTVASRIERKTRGLVGSSAAAAHGTNRS